MNIEMENKNAIREIEDIAKLFKTGYVCADFEKVMWVPNRPVSEFQLLRYKEQNGGIRLGVRVASCLGCVHMFVNCVTGSKHLHVDTDDIVFKGNDGKEVTFNKITNPECKYMRMKKGEKVSFKLLWNYTEKKLDQEGVQDIIEEVNWKDCGWKASFGKKDGHIYLTRT